MASVAALHADESRRFELLAARTRTGPVGQRLRRTRFDPGEEAGLRRAGGRIQEATQVFERPTARDREGRERLGIVRSLSRGLHTRARGRGGTCLPRSVISEARALERGRSRVGCARHHRKQRAEANDRRTAARPGSGRRLCRAMVRIARARERVASARLDNL